MEHQEDIVVKKDQSYYRGERHDVFALVPTNVHRILEIGCGSGRFRQNFKDDVEYWGVEPVQAAAQEAVGLTRVLVGTLDAVADSLPDGYFDLVVCNDVIEHIVDTQRTLAIIRTKMTADGWLVGSLPNVRSVWVLLDLIFRRDWRYREYGVLDSTHVRFFTFKSARRMLTEGGFKSTCLRDGPLGIFGGRSFCLSSWLRLSVVLAGMFAARRCFFGRENECAGT